MAGLHHAPLPPDEPRDPAAERHNARLGLVLFAVYLLGYVGFILVNAFAPAVMDEVPVAGLNVADLPPGTRLSLGDLAVLEIVKGRTGCSRLEAAQGKAIAGLGPIGVLARVAAGGMIRVGDPVASVEMVAV